jgi:hypothetical protein
MAFLDSPVLAGRTPRELAILSIGVFGTVWGFTGLGYYGWQWSLGFAVPTVLFALRAWPARGFALGACIASLAQWMCVSGLREWPWICNVPVVAIALLSSRDLVARFDAEPSRIPLLRNPFATMPEADACRLRWSAYAFGVLASVLCQMWCMGASGFPATPLAFWSLGAIVFLLVTGRAVALLPLVAFAAAAIASLLPAAVASDPHGVGRAAPITAILCAGVGVALSGPYAWKLLRRALAPARPRAEGRMRVAAVDAPGSQRLRIDEEDLADTDDSARRAQVRPEN